MEGSKLLSQEVPKLERIHKMNAELLMRLQENVGSLESKILVLEGSNSIKQGARPDREEKRDGALVQFESQQDDFRYLLDRLDLVVELLNRII
jgi:hypothetical protein